MKAKERERERFRFSKSSEPSGDIFTRAEITGALARVGADRRSIENAGNAIASLMPKLSAGFRADEVPIASQVPKIASIGKHFAREASTRYNDVSRKMCQDTERITK